MITKLILVVILFLSLGLIATMNLVTEAHEGIQRNSESIMRLVRIWEKKR